MDESEQTEPGTGPASDEAEAESTVSFEETEKRLDALATKYKGKHNLTAADVESGEQKEFTRGWEAQEQHWKTPYEDFVAIANDINQYVSLRYKGVPDLLVAAAVLSAGQHLMGMVTATQIRHMERGENNVSDLARAVAEKMGLAVSDPQGHG